MTHAKKFFTLLLALSFLAPVQSFASTSTRVDGDRAYFANVIQSEDVLTQFPSGISKLSDQNPANLAYGGGGAIGNVHFSLRGLKGWDLQNSSVGAFPKCNSSADLECQKIMRLRSYMATLPPCLSQAQSDCISRLSVTRSDNTKEDALPIKLLGRAVQDQPKSSNDFPFPADKSVNLPAGGEKWLWSFPKYRHTAGSLFIPSVSLWQQVDITSINDPYRYPNPNVWISLSPVAAESSNLGSPYRIHSAPDFDLRRETFTAPDSFTIEFRTTAPWTTWNKSSLSDIAIETRKSGSDFIYSVTGKPSSIPEVGKNIPITKANYEELKRVTGGNFNCPGIDADLSTCSGVIYVGGKGGISDEAFNRLEEIEKLIDKKSEASTFFWLVQTSIETPLSPRVQQCTKEVAREQPAGTVSSNATLQQDGPPLWSEADQSFSYRVGALSKLPNGDDFKGTYTLQLASEMAQCIWGSRPTAQSLSIQIINSDKSLQLVTSSTSTIGETFVFNASGFHFSSPRILVKAENLVVINPTKQDPVSISQGETASSTNKKKTIVCSKGKKRKKLTGEVASSLKCPRGWQSS